MSVRREKMAVKLQAQVDRFNDTHPVGTAVEYRSHTLAPPIKMTTRSEAWVLAGHTAVVMLEGMRGCVALDFVTDYSTIKGV